MTTSVIPFIRRRDYTLVKELGQGACGKTVLLFDPLIEEHFVCKKYVPFDESQRQQLFAHFVREIKLLHQVLHRNVVRVFNYFLYPDQFAGYLLMEYISGKQLDAYVHDSPERLSDLFVQAVEGFAHLEAHRILHRDIRPANLLVRDDGVLKIIDLGFGKRIADSDDFDKSISLNWWCATPAEFGERRYDHATEVYFVGKLFEQMIADNGIHDFQYDGVLGGMCQHEPSDRLATFQTVLSRMQAAQFSEVNFSIQDTETFRGFSALLRRHISKIESGASYVVDVDLLLDQLERVYRSLMLEATAPDSSPILQCFLRGPFYYRKEGFPVSTLKDFLRLLKASSADRRRILLANIHTSLDALVRYNTPPASDDDVPF